MNCPQLRELGIGRDSFKYYEVLEVKNLPSLQSIRLDDYVFCNCKLVVFESKRDKWMINQIFHNSDRLHWDHGLLMVVMILFVPMYYQWRVFMTVMITNWLDLPSLSLFKGDYNFSYMRIVRIESMIDDSIRFRYS